MNAVKRCLALFAATLVVGACGGDPTADDAGANLTIRATPGVVWMRDNTTATVLLEAVDPLGGAQPGSWTATTIVGPLVATLDPTYQETSSGPVGNAQQWIISTTAAGEGFIVFTGTGGVDTVRVRVAPNETSFLVTANDSTPALFQAITLTAPAGIVFTGGTTVRFNTGPAAGDSANGGLSFPTILSRSADSSQITFVPGPGARGFARITGVASRSTPTLTSTAQTAFQFGTVPQVDTLTAGFNTVPVFATTGTRVTANFLDTLVITAPTGYVWLPSTTIEFFRILAPTTANPSGYTVANGTSAPVKLSLSADSTVMRWVVAPGARGRLKIRNIAFRNAPAINFRIRDLNTNTFDQRSGIIAGAPDTANIVWTFNRTAPLAEGDTVRVTAPTGWVFLAGTASLNAGSSNLPSGGDSARIISRSADSSSVVVKLAPGASGKYRYGSVGRRDKPALLWQARGGAFSAVAAPAVVATMTPTSGNMNDTITVALDGAGPYRFRPTSSALLGGFVSLITSISADSITMKLLPPPGFTGTLTLTNIRYASLPTFQVQAATASSVTVNAATSLGGDDPKAGPAIYSFAAPTAAGQVRGFWDQATLGAADYTGDGGVTAQYYRITAAANRTVNFKVDWTQGTAATTDIDFGLVADDGSFDAFVGGVTSGLASGKPENANYTLVAGQTYILAVIDYAGNIISTTAVKVTMVGQ